MPEVLKLDGTPNPILDSETPADKLRAAIAAERELMILASPNGTKEYIHTGKNAFALENVIKSGQTRVIRSKQLDGPYYLGLFDAQLRLRVLIKGVRALPKAKEQFTLEVRGKVVVSEYVEKVEIIYGRPAAICYCKTTLNWR